MDKNKALEKLELVKSKRTADYIQEVLIKIEDYINNQETFSYQETMKFIQEQMSCKMGSFF